VEIITPEEFKSLMDAFTTRIKGGDYHECDDMTVNMYYRAVAIRLDSTELIEKFNQLYREWDHYRLPSPEEWLKAGAKQHKTNASAYQVFEPNDDCPLIASAKQTDIDKAAQSKKNRITILAAIYEKQGKSKFYKDMLKGRSGSYGEMIAKLTGHSGEITHDEVIERIAKNAESKNPRKKVVA
jgi:hypothetical protein